MTKYELVVLLPDEEETKPIKTLLTSLKAKVIKEESWGNKTLAYRVKKQRSAHFYDWIIELEGKNVVELTKKLNFNEKLLRYLLLQVE